MPSTLRPMMLADYDAVLALWQNTEGVGLNDSDTREKTALYLERNPDLSFVATDASGEITGAVLGGHDGRRGYLHHLAVAKNQRGHGLGRRLVEACLGALQQHGINRCNIFVYADNVAGQAFWRHLGWNSRSELLLMQKPTSPAL